MLKGTLCRRGSLFSSHQYKFVKVSGIGFIYKKNFAYINRGTMPISGKMEGEIFSCVEGLKHPEALCGITTILGQGFPYSLVEECP